MKMGTRLIRLLVPRPNRMRRIKKIIIAGTVSVITNKNQRGPKKDWLKIVGSNSTKRKIRAWLKKDNKDEE